MSVDCTNVNFRRPVEPVCEKREAIPLIVDENYKRLCECEAMLSRITEIVKGESPPLSETVDVKCLIDAVMRNREIICRVGAALKSVLDVFDT